MTADQYTFGEITINGAIPLLKVPKNWRDYIGILETTDVPNLPQRDFLSTSASSTEPGVSRTGNEKNCEQEYLWPAHSPYALDLNPINSVCMKRQLQCMVLDHDNMVEAVMDIWSKITIKLLQILHQSMPNRVNQCLKDQGFPIKY